MTPAFQKVFRRSIRGMIWGNYLKRSAMQVFEWVAEAGFFAGG
jgi:hypothetical protein